MSDLLNSCTDSSDPIEDSQYLFFHVLVVLNYLQIRILCSRRKEPLYQELDLVTAQSSPPSDNLNTLCYFYRSWLTTVAPLQAHFRQEHLLCENPECLAKKFVVFSSDAELKVVPPVFVRNSLVQTLNDMSIVMYFLEIMLTF
jgi:hypothetical protein